MKNRLVKIKRAIISVNNKTKLLDLADFFLKRKIEIISTGGTSKYLSDNGYKVEEVSKLTGFPELINGRVKTLHPNIHAPILFDRSDKGSVEELKNRGLRPIDIVIVNLYPFEEKVRDNCSKKEIIENIDIGGVALIRAAAKNYENVTVLTNISDYRVIKTELEENNGCVGIDLRKFLAGKAFLDTAFYDQLISEWFLSNDEMEKVDKRVIAGNVKTSLKYGENPHQKGIYISKPFLMEKKDEFTQIKGEKLSFNNFIDITAAYKILSELNSYRKPACTIIKHSNPCGVAISETPFFAYSRALNSDPVSAFGGIVGINRKVDVSLARKISKTFTEILLAPDFTLGALEIFSKKKKIKVLKIRNFDGKLINKEDFKSVIGGNLIQTTDTISSNSNSFEIVTKLKPSKFELEDLLFLWKIVKHVKSNAIVIGKNLHIGGVGAGQANRVRSVEIAIKQNNEFSKENKKLDTELSLGLASDAFFPFPDSLEIAAKNGIFNIIQPGGSKKDEEIIETANRLNQKMIFTKVRHFIH